MNFDEFVSMGYSTRNCDLEMLKELRNLKKSVILSVDLDEEILSPKSQVENYIIHDAEENMNKNVVEPFFDDINLAVKTALNLDGTPNVTEFIDNPDEYPLNIWNDDNWNNLSFCFIDETNENDKTINIYRNPNTEPVKTNEEYPVLIILKKIHSQEGVDTEKFTYYYYRSHNMFKVQKVWNYNRIVHKCPKKYTKKHLMDFVKENRELYDKVKMNMKKQDMYDCMCKLNFEFF